ncbi:maleylpyruvate isomerase family mycothiol-dependent enzyme [Actinokineospora sp. HUAS TT18]|uniref:maleylpyruvate isomerase family mycothiol-dependent enzyme n=1 Tax=Actinokineospora sp. HUAS TT18 TaxID=3447451 RepID=UPI003F5274A8
MNDDEVWAAIDTQRLRTADFLASLGPEDFAHDSLCDGWTVRDVAAHLTQQQLGLGEALRGLLRHPGSINHMIREGARHQARMSTEDIIAAIRAMVGSRRHNIGVTQFETLVDIVVHGQDMAVPLSGTLEVDPAAAAAAATRVWSYHDTRQGRRKARVFKTVPYEDYRFTATDTDWSAGSGPEISGPIVAILLALTGRAAGMVHLTGAADNLMPRA